MRQILKLLVWLAPLSLWGVLPQIGPERPAPPAPPAPARWRRSSPNSRNASASSKRTSAGWSSKAVGRRRCRHRPR
jgi:hypothetical protein